MSGSWRKCFFGCQGKAVLYTFPKEEDTRGKWAEFVFGDQPFKKNSFVCARHFTNECFINKDLVETGKVSRLTLRHGAVPTIKCVSPLDSKPNLPSCSSDKSSTPKTKRSVGTQLSMGTLQFHRSKGVQVTASTFSRGTNTEQPWDPLSSTTVKPAILFGKRPAKRPRVEVKEEEEEEGISFAVPLTQDSTYEPDISVTDVSDMSELESSFDCMDAKYIVFESCLRELFDKCPICTKQCVVLQRRCGTFVAFVQQCPHCSYSRSWQSQPMKNSTPLGNLQLSAAVYFSGGSFVQMSNICKSMNLKVHQYDSFRRHARTYLEPAIYHKWKVDQEKLFVEMQAKEKVAVCGDMRVDSPGHSAKFGTYTLMELGTNKILDLQLVQSNEVGGSFYMEKEGLKRCLDHLESNLINLDYIVTDRHSQIQKYLQERGVTQYHDVWHLVKGLSKKLEALAKSKDCTIVKKWLPAIKNHMYWSAGSSTTGPEKVAKWKSLVNHIQNVHTHEDPLFPKCLHPERVSRDPNKWFKPGTVALYKVDKMLLNKRVLCDVAKLSSTQQTSSLESFHSVIIQFLPKNVAFPFTGRLCRLYLAAMHFNENVAQEQATSNEKLACGVTFPEPLRGRPPAGPVKTEDTYEYVSDLMKLVFSDLLEDPAPFVEQLKRALVPEDLRAQFERPQKDDHVAVPHFNPGVAHSLQAGSELSGHQDQEIPCGSREQETMALYILP